jgi:hypothetical protein
MKTKIWMLLVVMAVFAVPSYAQYRPLRADDEITPTVEPWYGEVSYASGQELDNPCTAAWDPVYVNYAADVAAAQEELGLDQYRFNESTTVGGMYSASGSSEANVGYSAPFAVRKYHKVNTPDNFHVVTVINFDPAARYTWVTVETACGNGMPDSAQ